MVVGCMFNKLWIKLRIKWEYLKFYSMHPMKWWVVMKLKYFNKGNNDV